MPKILDSDLENLWDFCQSVFPKEVLPRISEILDNMDKTEYVTPVIKVRFLMGSLNHLIRQGKIN